MIFLSCCVMSTKIEIKKKIKKSFVISFWTIYFLFPFVWLWHVRLCLPCPVLCMVYLCRRQHQMQSKLKCMDSGAIWWWWIYLLYKENWKNKIITLFISFNWLLDLSVDLFFLLCYFECNKATICPIWLRKCFVIICGSERNEQTGEI